MKHLSVLCLAMFLLIACSSNKSELNDEAKAEQIKEIEQLEKEVEQDLKETEAIKKELDSLINTY